MGCRVQPRGGIWLLRERKPSVTRKHVGFILILPQNLSPQPWYTEFKKTMLQVSKREVFVLAWPIKNKTVFLLWQKRNLNNTPIFNKAVCRNKEFVQSEFWRMCIALPQPHPWHGMKTCMYSSSPCCAARRQRHQCFAGQRFSAFHLTTVLLTPISNEL